MTDISKFVTRHGKRIEVEVLDTGAPSKHRTNEHFGCPLEWARRVRSVVKSADQMLVAIWLHRRHSICKSDLFSVPNDKLKSELGVSRKVKYQALHYLEEAGAITIVRGNKRAPLVRILW